MKIAVKDLKKAVAWIEGNTNAEWIHLKEDGNRLLINSIDKGGCIIEIELYIDSNLLPKIRKTETL